MMDDDAFSSLGQVGKKKKKVERFEMHFTEASALGALAER